MTTPANPRPLYLQAASMGASFEVCADGKTVKAHAPHYVHFCLIRPAMADCGLGLLGLLLSEDPRLLAIREEGRAG